MKAAGGGHDARSWLLLSAVLALAWSLFFGLSFTGIQGEKRLGLALQFLFVGVVAVSIMMLALGTPTTSKAAFRFLAIWGVSLPLTVTYLSPIAHRGALPLAANAIFIALALAWANWTAASLDRQAMRTRLSALGTGCLTAGGALGIWAWGSATAGEWPMEPYLTYMSQQPLLYAGLLLVGIGAILRILATPRELACLSAVLPRLHRALLSRLKGLVILALVLVVFVGVVVLCKVFAVPFPKEFERVDATHGAGKSLIRAAERLDLSKFFTATGSQPPPRYQEPPPYVDGRILRQYVARSWRFRLRVPDNPGFRENGWLRYGAKVDFFNGTVARKGPGLMVASADLSTAVRAPGAYWYREVNETTIREGFVVRMSLSYGEVYANLGGKGFDLDDQYFIFDEQRQLVAILAPLIRIWRA